MNRFGLLAWSIVLLFLGSAGGWGAPVRETGFLVWRAQENRVDANVDGWPLEKVLGKIAASTGWEIYLEPDTREMVTAKFKRLEPGEALRLLLGQLNFALIPETGGLSRLYVYRTALYEATQLVAAQVYTLQKPAAGQRIPNELIVTLKPDGKTDIDALAKRLGAKVIGQASGLNAYRLEFADEQSAQVARDQLRAESDIAQVDANYLVEAPTRIDRIALSSAPPFNLRPKGTADESRVVVGLIDTAVQNLDAKMSSFLLPGVSVMDSPGAGGVELTHGTSMAETILRGLSLATADGQGSPVRILPVDVYGRSETTTTFDIARGIYAAISNGATLINLSMGSEGESSFLNNLIVQSHKQGVLFFGAAGNEPSTQPVYPAAYPEVVAVTAGDQRGRIAPYANRGDFVDVIAPGMSIVQANGQSYLVTGTSASTAYVSGTAAAYRATGKSGPEVESLIREKLALPKPGAPVAKP